MKEGLGYVLISIPLLAIITFTFLNLGWKVLLLILLIVGSFLALMFGGAYLIKGSVF